jgi:hypothetical protein
MSNEPFKYPFGNQTESNQFGGQFQGHSQNPGQPSPVSLHFEYSTPLFLQILVRKSRFSTPEPASICTRRLWETTATCKYTIHAIPDSASSFSKSSPIFF